MELRTGKTLPNTVLPTYKILIFPHFIQILSDFLHAIFLMNFLNLGLKGGRREGRNETGEQKREEVQKKFFSNKKIVFFKSLVILKTRCDNVPAFLVHVHRSGADRQKNDPDRRSRIIDPKMTRIADHGS